MKKVMIFGMSPLPFENDLKAYGTGIRTWQFALPLIEEGSEVCLVNYAIPSAYDKNFSSKKWEIFRYKNYGFKYHILLKEDFENIEKIKEIFFDFKPDCILGCTFYPSYTASRLLSSLADDDKVPFWADLFGHVMAEAQARAFIDSSDDCLFHYWNGEYNIISQADVFSCVSQRQALALAGELGACGRLNMHTSGYDFSHVCACGMPDEEYAHEKTVFRDMGRISAGDFVVLWTGGYNTWTDIDTLFEGLCIAMQENPKIKFVSTGGEIPEQDIKTYPRFLDLISKSSFKDNFLMKGWIDGKDVPNYYFEADTGINIDKDIYEVRLGSKNRILDWMRAGLCVLSTNVCELTDIIENNKLGFTFKTGNARDLASVLLYMSKNRDEVKKRALQAKDFGRSEFNFKKTVSHFLKWAKEPSFAPDRFKAKKIFFDKEEALKNSAVIIEDQINMIKGKDERIKELELMLGKRFFPRIYGYLKVIKRKIIIKNRDQAGKN